MIDCVKDTDEIKIKCRTCQSCTMYYAAPEEHSDYGFCTEFYEYCNRDETCFKWECWWNTCNCSKESWCEKAEEEE